MLITLTGHRFININLYFQMNYVAENGEKKVISFVKHNNLTYVGKNVINFDRNYSEPVIEELTNQLEGCRQLLDLEPNNKCKIYI